ncbi:2-hydroxyacyl-CoA dehydratase family protein [Facklamia hominis]|uniref:2-hydroxyacyl-CoA dehydratase family protein n=1 Tax=Facklamia hominis TaxID=178214 RepID=UPI002889E500|nr:2-hydroxyacyl-CoA dehydratase family protein [Facklamia hominis]
MILLEDLEIIRRQGFIEAMNRASRQTIVAIFGRVPWEVFYAFDILPIRAYAADAHVIEERQGYCTMLDATIEYYRLNRCPYMHFAKAYIVDDLCPLRLEALTQTLDPVYIYRDLDELIRLLEEKTQQRLDLAKLEAVIQQSQAISRAYLALNQAALDPSIINQAHYQAQFIFDLDQRLAFLQDLMTDQVVRHPMVMTNQLAGIQAHLQDQVQLVGWGCEEERHLISDQSGLAFLKEKYQSQQKKIDYQPCGCPFNEGAKQLTYEGEQSCK